MSLFKRSKSSSPVDAPSLPPVPPSVTSWGGMFAPVVYHSHGNDYLAMPLVAPDELANAKVSDVDGAAKKCRLNHHHVILLSVADNLSADALADCSGQRNAILDRLLDPKATDLNRYGMGLLTLVEEPGFSRTRSMAMTSLTGIGCRHVSRDIDMAAIVLASEIMHERIPLDFEGMRLARGMRD